MKDAVGERNVQAARVFHQSSTMRLMYAAVMA
jgi:hypothetical protein